MSSKKDQDLLIAVFDGGTDGVLRLNFSFLNLKFYKVDSKEFIQFVDSFNDYFPGSDFSSTFYYQLLYDQPGGFHPNLYAIAPIDFAKGTDSETIFKIRSVLLIMFPSDFQLSSLVFYDKAASGKYHQSFMNSWRFVSHWFLKGENCPLDEFLIKVDRRKTRSVNSFAKYLFNFLSDRNDFEIAVESYLEAFSQESAKMAYINYCIALESLVKSTEGEITYRICRTAAVVNADSNVDGDTIFFNMKQFYALRSRIVHGDRTNQLREYFFKLQALVSRTLIEIATLNVPDREVLFKYVNENGYGDKKRFATRYRKQIINEQVIQLVVDRVSKYKR